MMKKLLSALSILVYIAYSQKCSNTHPQSTLLSISINGPSINKIGVREYLSIINSAADIILPVNPTVGIRTFGGITINNQPVGSGTRESQIFGSTTYSSVNSTITTLPASNNFDTNQGNVVSSAIKDAISILSSASGQKYHVIFAAGNPRSNGFGTTTNPINTDDPCSNGVLSKKANIQTYVVLIGKQGINFVKEYYSCLVENPSTDIIIIDPISTAAGLSQLSLRLCKPNGYDIKITEVNPVNGGYWPFIEIFNRGASATVTACWGTANNTCSGTVTLETGEYFIAHTGSGSGSNPSLGDKNQSDLPVNPEGSGTSWTATAQDGSGNIYDTVIYNSTGDSGISYWQQPITGRSFELRDIGYNNKYGGNWRASCYPNVGGSPGNASVECEPLFGSCSNAGACYINGASGVSCIVPNDDYCDCPSGYLGDIDTCITMPVPTACNGYVNYDAVTDKDWMYFTWKRLDWDGDVKYTMKYLIDGGGTSTLGPFGVAVGAVNNYQASLLSSGSMEITLTMAYTSPIQDKIYTVDTVLTCSITTLKPTVSPTIKPTISPVNIPSIYPTLSPTFDEPGVFIAGDICGPDRCECFEESRDCCTPFGPSYGPTLTAGNVPSDGSGCNHKFWSVQIPPSAPDQYTTDIKIKLYPNDYTSRTTVKYTMTAYGIINITDFHNVIKWTNLSRRSLIEQNRRNLLQTTTTLNTPSPTYIYGNKLNIKVSPPGMTSGFDGIVTIDEGDEYGTITLNISTTSVKCIMGEECMNIDECINMGLGFGLVLSSCTTDGHNICTPLYPHILWISVSRSPSLCTISYPPKGDNDELPDWFWWVLIVLIVFLLIMSWLVYRFWWKQKLKKTQLNDVRNELVEQEYDNNQGITKDLDRGDMMFNNLATGVPGYNYSIDPHGNELYQRQIDEQQQMIDPDAVTWRVREPVGPVMTEDEHYQQKTENIQLNINQNQHEYPTPIVYTTTHQ